MMYWETIAHYHELLERRLNINGKKYERLLIKLQEWFKEYNL